MLKRFIGISFILFASIIVLVHSSIPHHHHSNQVCIKDSHCQKDEKAHHHESEMPYHEHDGENDYQVCILKQDLVIPANTLRQAFLPQINDRNPGFLFDYQAILLNVLQTYPFQLFGSFRFYQGFHISLFTLFVNQGLGLRAPPLV